MNGTPILRWLSYLLLISGGAALGWCASIVTDASIAQRLARARLESIPRATVSSPAPSAARSSKTVETGTPLAELSIPRIGLSAVVLQGTDDRTLRVALGHIETTPLPGESGNVAIAGHRDSFFRPLRNVQIGDDILLDTPDARVRYRVSSFRVVNASEVSVIGPTSDAVLTLVTCYPFQFIGSAPDRFVVRASRVEARQLPAVLQANAAAEPDTVGGRVPHVRPSTRPKAAAAKVASAPRQRVRSDRTGTSKGRPGKSLGPAQTSHQSAKVTAGRCGSSFWFWRRRRCTGA